MQTPMRTEARGRNDGDSGRDRVKTRTYFQHCVSADSCGRADGEIDFILKTKGLCLSGDR